MSLRVLPIGLLLASLLAAALPAQQSFYEAMLDGSGVIRGGMPGSTSTATGSATFVLNRPPGGPVTLDYHIELPDFDVDGSQTPDRLDNVTGVHLHDTTQCLAGVGCVPGDTAFTVHVMNIWGFPRGGDDQNDLVIDPVARTLTGRWDDGDANDGTGVMAPTYPISDPRILSLLMNGQMAVMVHTEGFPNAAIGGTLHAVPEPSGLACFGLVLLGLRRRMAARL